MAILRDLSKPMQDHTRQATPITFKVSEKGAVSVYGLGRFPVTLYKDQWEAIFENSDRLADFIASNSSRLSVKAP